MTGLVDVHHRQPCAIGLSDREMEIVADALAYRKVDYVGMRRLCEKTGATDDQLRFGRLILELDLVRMKLGIDDSEDESDGSRDGYGHG